MYSHRYFGRYAAEIETHTGVSFFTDLTQYPGTNCNTASTCAIICRSNNDGGNGILVYPRRLVSNLCCQSQIILESYPHAPVPRPVDLSATAPRSNEGDSDEEN